MVKYISSIYNINTQIEKELKNVPREAYKEYIISSLIEEIQHFFRRIHNYDILKK